MIKLDRPSEASVLDDSFDLPGVKETLNRAKLAYQQLDFDLSASLYEGLISQHPGVAQFHQYQAEALMAAGRMAAASGSAEQAVKLNPSSGEYYATAALVQLKLGNLRLARRRASEAVRLDQRRPSVLHLAARVLRETGDHARASEITERIIQLAPSDPAGWYLKASLAGDLARKDEAESALGKTLALQPGHSKALAALANVLQPGLEDKDIVTLLEAHRSGNVVGADPVPAVYALADIYHRAGKFDEAFGLYEEVNQAQVKSRPFAMEAFEQGVDAVIEATRDQQPVISQAGSGGVSAVRQDLGGQLVFVVGMPRTGTTLLEQALCTHPQVLGCGLLNSMEAAERMLESEGVMPLITHGPQTASAAQRAAARTFYLGQLPSQHSDFRWVIDNNPLNFQRLPMIQQMFPAARFIYMRRHPLDSVLACFFHHFQAGMNFSVSIQNTSRYYAAQHRLMAHWQSLDAASIEEIWYEDLVQDLPATLARLCKFLALDEEPRMHAPHRNARPVMSASTWEVRQPVHARHVAMWKNYQSKLESVIGYFQTLDILDESLRAKN